MNPDHFECDRQNQIFFTARIDAFVHNTKVPKNQTLIRKIKELPFRSEKFTFCLENAQSAVKFFFRANYLHKKCIQCVKALNLQFLLKDGPFRVFKS